MDRKKAVIAAATVAGSLLAASTAYALTSGIVDGGPDDGAGNLSPIVEAPRVSDDAASTTTSVGEVTAGPVTDDHQAGDDDAFEREDQSEGDHDSKEPFEYEGREDDD